MMVAGKEVEESSIRIAQELAPPYSLNCATQRPSADVVLVD